MDEKPKRRWQFGTRSLFVAVLLVAIGLTLWRAYVSPFARQKQGIDELLAQGVSVSTSAADGPAWQRWLVGEDDFVQVGTVKFTDKPPWVADENRVPIDDRAIDALVKLRSVGFLNLSQTQITNEQLQRLAAIPRTRHLQVQSTLIGDAGVKHLPRFKGLKGLSLTRTLVSDEGLEAVGQLTDLEYFELESPNVEGSGVAHIANLTKLNELQFSGPSVTNEWIRHVAVLPSLEWVELHSTRVDDGAIPFMSGWKNVQKLYLNKNRFTTEALHGLWQTLPNLKVLEAGGNQSP